MSATYDQMWAEKSHGARSYDAASVAIPGPGYALAPGATAGTVKPWVTGATFLGVSIREAAVGEPVLAVWGEVVVLGGEAVGAHAGIAPANGGKFVGAAAGAFPGMLLLGSAFSGANDFQIAYIPGPAPLPPAAE